MSICRLFHKDQSRKRYQPDAPTLSVFVTDYLSVLEIDDIHVKPEEPSLKLLERLLWQQSLHVPFDSSSLLMSGPHPIELDPQNFLSMIKKHSGGLDYQLHAAFKRLLSELGFKVIMPSAKMYSTAGYGYTYTYKDYAKHNNHSVLLVEIDEEKYLIDLAWQPGLCRPIKIAGDTYKGTGQLPRRCVYVPKLKYFMLEVFANNNWQKEYTFLAKDTEVKTDYEKAIAFDISKSSHLSHTLVVWKMNNDGGYNVIAQSINDNDFKNRLIVTTVLPDDFYNTTIFTQSNELFRELRGGAASVKLVSYQTMIAELGEFGMNEDLAQIVLSKFDINPPANHLRLRVI
jgi:arylamine N-acetyltransferase